MQKKLFSEILKDVAAAPDARTKVSILQHPDNNTLMLRQLLAATVNPSVHFDVSVPSYRENSEIDGYATNSLAVEVRRLYIFLDTYKIDPKRKSSLLGQILEAIDPSDAVALIDVIHKDLTKYGINREIVDQAFPGLLK